MTDHCQVCGWKRFLILDHSHVTGLVRGYVCEGCNTRLANIERGQHKHFRYLYRNLSDTRRNARYWLRLDANCFRPSLQGYPPAILRFDDIEVIRFDCELLHQYLQTPPLAYLNLRYRTGMKLEGLNN